MSLKYSTPEFNVIKMAKEDVLTTSETVFGELNGFEAPSITPSLSTGGWNMPSITL